MCSNHCSYPPKKRRLQKLITVHCTLSPHLQANMGAVVASNNIAAHIRGRGQLLGFPSRLPTMAFVTIGKKDGELA